MKDQTDELVIRFATHLMWATLTLTLGIGLGFAWRSICSASEKVEVQTAAPVAKSGTVTHE
jgi:hypothetical protein